MVKGQVIPFPRPLDYDEFYCAVQNAPWPIITTARKTVQECKSAAAFDAFGAHHKVTRPARYWPKLEAQGWTIMVFRLREYRPRKKKAQVK